MLNELGLGGGVKFLIRRLVTLWRNSNWSNMITRWCETRVSRETFNVSSWDEMARYRVDDVCFPVLRMCVRLADLVVLKQYWFNRFNNVLGILDWLVNGDANKILLSDWMALARMPRPRDHTAVLDLFCPLIPTNSRSECRMARRPGFPDALSEEDYNLAHSFVGDSAEVVFEDLSQFMREYRHEERIISEIITHVSCWLNYKPPYGSVSTPTTS